MSRGIFGIYTLFCCLNYFAQQTNFPQHLSSSQISKLQSKDSITYYQCYVDSATQEITTKSGKNIKFKKQRITVTEKFTITLTDSGYVCKYYQSPITHYPNKKFPYLTLKETTSWDFELIKTKLLTDEHIKLLAAFETKTHAITNYELNINKSCANEVIIKRKNTLEQLIVEGDYLLNTILQL